MVSSYVESARVLHVNVTDLVVYVWFSQGSAEALNGLGWYYSTIKKDKRRAIRYFEQAAQNGSRDGLFNVGVYHLNGENPDKPHKNEVSERNEKYI